MKTLLQTSTETCRGLRIFTPKAPIEIKKAADLKLSALYCIRDLVEIEMKDAVSSVKPHLQEAYNDLTNAIDYQEGQR